jgi:hypothetical protein
LLREIISGLLIVVILIAGFLAYIVLYDVKEIESPSLTLNKEQYQTDSDLDGERLKSNLIRPFKNSIKAQNSWLTEQSEVKADYQNILDGLLTNQNVLYIEEYKNDLEDKRKQLELQFVEFKDRIDKITDKEIEYYSSMIDYEMEQSLDNLREKYDQEFADYEKQVQQENSNELLNYRLKLETLDLTEEKAAEYRSKIEEIENNRSIKINNKLNEIYYELRIRSEELTRERDQKIAELKKQFLNKKEEQIEQKNIELENMFAIYQRNRYTALKNSMDEFEENLEQDTAQLLAKSDIITDVVQSDLEVLNNTYLENTEERN